MTMGTFGFMAPEQRDDAVRAGIPADIFSIGATLLSLLIGRPPADIPSGLEALSTTLPLSLSQLLMRSTLSQPDRRHASVSQLTRALRSSLTVLPEVPKGTPSLHIPIRAIKSLPPARPTLVLPEE